MKNTRRSRNIALFLLAIAVIYVATIILLIADKANDQELLYFVEITVSIVLVLFFILIINKVDIYHILSNIYNAVLEGAPYTHILYDLEKKELVRSTIKELGGYEVSSLESVLSKMNPEDANFIRAKIQAIEILDDFQKSGLISIHVNEDFKYYFYSCAVVKDQFNHKFLIIWIWDATGDIVEKIGLLKLMQDYRHKHFELNNVIANLPYPLWICRENLVLLENKLAEQLSKNYGFVMQDELVGGDKFNKRNQLDKKFISSNKSEQFHFFKNDITDKNSIITALEYSKEEDLRRKHKSLEGILEKLMDNLTAGFLVLDQDQKAITYNLAFLNLFEIDEGVMAQKPSYKYVLELMRERYKFPEIKDFKEKHLSLLQTVTNYATDLWHLSNGSTIRVTIIPNESNNTILIFENITPNIELEHELYNTKMVINYVLDLIDYPIVGFGHNHLLLYCNKAFKDSFLKDRIDEFSSDPTLDNFCKIIGEMEASEDFPNKLKNLIIGCLEGKMQDALTCTFNGKKIEVSARSMYDQGMVLLFRG